MTVDDDLLIISSGTRQLYTVGELGIIQKLSVQSQMPAHHFPMTAEEI
jgi:hypothetical protein